MNQPDKAESARQGFIQAQAITKKYASTFYFASRFLAEDKRLVAYSVYAICRISDVIRRQHFERYKIRPFNDD